ncbi:MAG: 3-dehydroquinate synthase [Verrucomicrobia bacterium]|nr:3-dehydroquinate synthase [Verrucomicrobiota bacterium]
MNRACIDVKLGKDSYKVWISHDWMHEAGRLIRQIPSLHSVEEVMVFTSPVIGGLYFNPLKRSLKQAGFARVHRHDIPDGEQNKNFEQYGKCLSALGSAFDNPQALPLAINLGGGVIGDLGGFVAATFRRGIPYVQIPTTLLGCIDSSLGGKVDIDFDGTKNLIGQFYQPKLVFSDLLVLNTLEPCQVRSGVAEAIKYGAVYSRGLFEYLEKKIEDLLRLDPKVLMRTVTECVQIKAKVVSQDEKDSKNLRIVLNFGHTIGHAIESESDFKLLHGEAVSVGMVAATKLAVKLEICSEEVYRRLVALLQRAGLPIHAKKLRLNEDKVIARMKRDKKFVNGRNLFVLPTSIGSWCKKEGIDEGVIRKVALSDSI